jgi:hypothetical protein
MAYPDLFGIDFRDVSNVAAMAPVANHAFDCIGAKSAGMHSAFIDRRKLPFGDTPHQPDIIAPDMKSLADAML